MELQHLNVRAFAADPAGVDFEAFIPVFHDWIRAGATEELLIDVADYRHVPEGPGVLLVGHEADYGIDNAASRPAVRYNRKAPLPGSNADRLRQALAAVLNAAARLAVDERLGGFGVSTGELELRVNDRLLAPNAPETFQAVRGELEAFFRDLYGGEVTLRHDAADPRAPFSVTVLAPAAPPLDVLLARLEG